ncbi:hypothetical protein CCZ01_02610 [Helicobacter monodelphidis]|uniref:DNA adenine methylase n=1 Tax=Helicobacter sp. 15-1451 TaxID=2004995 RepID=UPI000DCBDC04|nr:DNA adenine methylase [Helicobacter sp. 15-1451]RAX58327.1 hypothetical protein CCZ01_02610 [Helicobacter sp. 15-1451]
MTKLYPKVNYIGNKLKVASWIIENLPIKNGKVLDLFCGGCSVSYVLKKQDFHVYSNDILYSNFVLAKALIENKNDKLKLDLKKIDDFFNIKDFENLKWMIDKLYFEHEVRELVNLINYSKTLKEYQNYLFLALLRRSMIRKIPYSRMTIKWEEIVKFRDEELSYKKYKRRRAYHNQPFLTHIKKELSDYNNAIFDNNQNNKAFHLDSLSLLKNLSVGNERIDLIYIDPPYPSTMNNYIGFYGGFDKMLNKNISNFLDFTKTENFLQNIKMLIIESKNITNLVAISLNNRCKPSVYELQNFLQNECKNIEIFQTTHTYKVTGKENKNIHNEILMILEI